MSRIQIVLDVSTRSLHQPDARQLFGGRSMVRRRREAGNDHAAGCVYDAGQIFSRETAQSCFDAIDVVGQEVGKVAGQN
ncbi:hypothetical protein MesoLj131b_60000 [Mesorhizobium sp. 131-2-5]|nr:hypothetical protein MesoLj131b_60000 [Mesorhizobium sp. 131-2-5]